MREVSYPFYLLQSETEAFPGEYKVTVVHLQCGYWRLVFVEHEIFEPWSGKTVTQLSRENLGCKDHEAFVMWAPSCGQVGHEGSAEIPWGVNSETKSIYVVPQNAVDGANDHFLMRIKGYGAPLLV
jgi:hypothetical protein